MFTNFSTIPSSTIYDCFYCGKKIDANAEIREVEFDHFISKANGGSDSRDNKVISCVECNRRKGSLNGIEYIALLEAEKEIEYAKN